MGCAGGSWKAATKKGCSVNKITHLTTMCVWVLCVLHTSLVSFAPISAPSEDVKEGLKHIRKLVSRASV